MTEYCPHLWPEESTPEGMENCRECGLYTHRTRMVWGEGNPEAPIMIILDNPGAREDREGNPTVCGTRQTLQHAVQEVRIKPEDLYVTFILKRKPVRAYDIDQVRQICMMHLEQQIQIKKPKLIVCLGNVAVQSFFKNTEVDVKSLRGSLHEVNGYKTAVAYHPLAVRRRPNLWNLFINDWQFISDSYNDIKKKNNQSK